MRSKKLFQIFESGISKTGPYFSNNARMLMAKTKLPKTALQTLPAPHSTAPEEVSLNVSSETSFEEALPDIRSKSPKHQIDSENDFSYIKTDFLHVCMLHHDEFFGLEWNLADIEDCSSMVFGDETDFKDLFFNLENF